MILDAVLVENFAGVYLSEGYADPQPTPAFHRECWELYCSNTRLVAVAAPRGHAKSTALTHDFGLASVCFRFSRHVLIVSSTEELAMTQLGDMAKELRENDELRAEFGITKLETDSKGEIVVLCDDGHRFRVIARGVEQRVRGMKWHGKRPDLILMDDVEEDEQVASVDRRKKLSRWVNRALIPAASLGARIRWHGTILHQHSMLSRLMTSKSWASRLYRAHASFNDFSEQLWEARRDPIRGMSNEEILKEIRQQFIDDQDAVGYSQEYLNDPRDDETNYIKKDWFSAMREADHAGPGIFGVGVDFAISKADKANRTSITTGKMDRGNMLHVVDQDVGRKDSSEIIDALFDTNDKWHPDCFWVESGQIWLSLWPTIKKEMLKRGKWLNFIPRTPIKDKASRGKSFQKRMKGGGMRWDAEKDWYTPMQEEILNFSESAEAQLDDQFDSVALLSLGFEEMPDVEDDDVMDEEERDMIAHDPRNYAGRNPTTGY